MDGTGTRIWHRHWWAPLAGTVAAVIGLAVAPAAAATARAPAASYPDQLLAGQMLAPGQSLRSANGEFELLMQTDGNLVEYGKSGTVIWAAGTEGTSGAEAVLRRNGDLEVVANGVVAWSSKSPGPRGAYVLRLQPDASLVVMTATDAVAWSAGGGGVWLKSPSGLSAGQLIQSYNGAAELVMHPNGQAVEYISGRPIWSSPTAGHPGARLVLRNGGDIVVIAKGRVLWDARASTIPGDVFSLGIEPDGMWVTADETAGVDPVWEYSPPTVAVGGATSRDGDAILDAAAAWVGKTGYCVSGDSPSGPTHGSGDTRGQAPNCAAGGAVGFDDVGLVLYAIDAATGLDLFPTGRGSGLLRLGSTVPRAAMGIGDVLEFGTGVHRHVALYAGTLSGTPMAIDAGPANFTHPNGVVEEPIADLDHGSQNALQAVLRY